MIWNDHSRDMPKGSHAFLSPSSHAWINYDDEKLTQVYGNKLAAARGTELHELACDLVRLRVVLPEEPKTLNMYVNDMIHDRMQTEMQLYYSKFCNGTADGIRLKDRVLRIYDLKTGKVPASFVQLEIYASLFFLEYNFVKPHEMEDVELRIYQNDEIRIEHPDVDILVPMMDKIKHFSNMLENLEVTLNGFDNSLWSGT